MYYVLDFGGTNLRISWSENLSKSDLISNLKIFPNTGNYNTDSSKILRFLEEVSSECSGIVIGVPGEFDQKEMNLKLANNLKDWINKPFFKELHNRHGGLVRIFKDSALAGIGEGMENSYSQSPFLYLSWGTGIGGCIVTQRTNALPDITTLDWKTMFSQIESLCGGKNAEEIYGKKLKGLTKSQWGNLADNFVNELLIICKKLQVSDVILGGGIPAKRDDIASLISTEIRKENVKLLQSSLGDLSAIYGGYYILSYIKQK